MKKRKETSWGAGGMELKKKEKEEIIKDIGYKKFKEINRSLDIFHKEADVYKK